MAEDDHSRYHQSREELHGLQHQELEKRQSDELAKLHARIAELEKHHHQHDPSEYEEVEDAS